MLNEEVAKYRELSGDTNPNTPISRIGGYLDGYEKALEQSNYNSVKTKLNGGMTEQWQELKETITEMRDNDGTGTQQEACKFLVNYMGVLEKQMQEPCEDAISRRAVLDICDKYNGQGYVWTAIRGEVEHLPSVNPQKNIVNNGTMNITL